MHHLLPWIIKANLEHPMSDVSLETKDQDKLIAMLINPKKPVEARANMLISLFHTTGDNPQAFVGVVTALLNQLAVAAPAAEVAELKAKYQQALKELEDGPARPATYIGPAEGRMPGPKPKVHVVAPDGHERFPALHPDIKVDELRPGMTVYLDPKGAIVMGYSAWVPPVGPQATFLRRVKNTGQVEVKIREEAVTLYATDEVLAAASDGTLARGEQVLIWPNRQFVFGLVPPDVDRRHRFIDRNKLPNVVASRDIGNPHWCLGWLTRRTHLLLFRPELYEKYDIRQRVSLLMTGASGTGKTLTIKAYLHQFHKMLVERLGREVESRVVRVKMSEQLSEWLGRSDKNFDQLFTDIQELASEEFTTEAGERIRLPVVMILEEVEGIARRRSEHDGAGGAYDRIMGTLLQRMDDPVDDLAKLPLVIISTSNKPAMIDVAMHRRLGSKVARFHRLDRQGLAAVLGKKLKPHYPFASSNGHSREALRLAVIDQVTTHLFSPPNDGGGQIEITLRDGTKLVKHARDFLSGALVEQAVSDVLDQAAFQAEASGREVGLESGAVIDALRRQIDALAENCNAYNVGDYIDLPDHATVASVRRLRPVGGPLNRLIAE